MTTEENSKDYDYLLQCNKQLSENELIRRLKNSSIIYYYCSSNKQSHSKKVILESKELTNYLLQVVINQQTILQRLNTIETQLNNKGASKEEDLLQCKKILESHGYLNSNLIRDDPVLGIKYVYDWKVIRLLNSFFKKNAAELNLIDFTAGGRGNPRVICKKDNEIAMRQHLKIKKEKKKEGFKRSEYEDIKQYILNIPTSEGKKWITTEEYYQTDPNCQMNLYTDLAQLKVMVTS